MATRSFPKVLGLLAGWSDRFGGRTAEDRSTWSREIKGGIRLSLMVAWV